YCLSLFSFRSHVPQDELSSVITGGLDYSKNVTAQQRAYGVAIAAASALIKVHTQVKTNNTHNDTPQNYPTTHTIHTPPHTHTHTPRAGGAHFRAKKPFIAPQRWALGIKQP